VDISFQSRKEASRIMAVSITFGFRIGHWKTTLLALNVIKHFRIFTVNIILSSFIHSDVSVHELSTFSGI